ncbi:MAG TPA: DUF2752 domain-containing protein [Candidatus Poseidoniales archaeon]|mgnify:FL=1|nr:MAG TPA: DUF2752 domain-containing protein [Candidatus Poseidoniales archaeon]|tara:strand:- start:799 stop:1200 length:402 start_codon:yes stop_codon:yes gene_type:complete
MEIMRIARGAIELAVTGGALATSIILPHGEVDGLRLCPWYHLTGIECPFCGMTRGFVAISHLDLEAALSFNLGSPLIYGAFIAIFGRSIWAWRMGQLNDPPPLSEKFTKPWLVTSIGVFGWMLYIRWIQPFLA